MATEIWSGKCLGDLLERLRLALVRWPKNDRDSSVDSIVIKDCFQYPGQRIGIDPRTAVILLRKSFDREYMRAQNEITIPDLLGVSRIERALDESSNVNVLVFAGKLLFDEWLNSGWRFDKESNAWAMPRKEKSHARASPMPPRQHPAHVKRAALVVTGVGN